MSILTFKIEEDDKEMEKKIDDGDLQYTIIDLFIISVYSILFILFFKNQKKKFVRLNE